MDVLVLFQCSGSALINEKPLRRRCLRAVSTQFARCLTQVRQRQAYEVLHEDDDRCLHPADWQLLAQADRPSETYGKVTCVLVAPVSTFVAWRLGSEDGGKC